MRERRGKEDRPDSVLLLTLLTLKRGVKPLNSGTLLKRRPRRTFKVFALPKNGKRGKRSPIFLQNGSMGNSQHECMRKRKRLVPSGSTKRRGKR